MNNLNQNSNWIYDNNTMYLEETDRPTDIGTSFYLFSESAKKVIAFESIQLYES